MNPILLVVIAISLSFVGIGMLALAGWADYRQARNHHRHSQKGNAHGCPPH